MDLARLSLMPGVVAAWRTTQEVLAQLSDREPVGEVEAGRIAELHQESDRRDAMAAHLLVRHCAEQLSDTRLTGPIELDYHCPACGSTGHGRPSLRLPDGTTCYASLSHVPGLVAAAAGRLPVGVDTELLSRIAKARAGAMAILHPQERALMATAAEPDEVLALLWARKEALVKLDRARLDALAAIDSTRNLAGVRLFERLLPSATFSLAVEVSPPSQSPRPIGGRHVSRSAPPP